MNKHTKRYDALVRMPKTMALIFVGALVMASVMAMALTSLHKLYVFYMPAETWLEVEAITIPDIDTNRPDIELYAGFRRKVHGDPVTAQWFSEVVLFDNAGVEQCRNRGINVYTDMANSSTIVVPLTEWFGATCSPPPGCYYQEVTWEFEIDGVKKSVRGLSNKFSIIGKDRTPHCRTLHLPSNVTHPLHPGALKG